jgi:hypothetical protein
MITAASYQDDSSPRRLLPQDPIGQRFLKYFHHGWGFIEAPMPERGERPNWRTEKRYPLEPRNLWSKYQDDGMLLGLGFGSQTNYMLLDIDRKSANHPENNQKLYDGILTVMEEETGLCRPVPMLSSDSDGIHVYYFLPWGVHSFTLASSVKLALVKAGYPLRDGQLEVFPNPKPYNPAKPTSFRAHRLPLQERSFLLDWDLQPISNDVETLLDQADWSARGQDMETLARAMEAAKQWCKKQYFWKRGETTAEQFCFDLQEVIGQGWTSFGQTNSFLLTLAKYGIIFLALSGEKLVQYMLETALNAPGYYQFCRHQHEIERRVRERARSAENYPYYPYSGKPPRNKTYKEHFGGTGEGNIIVFPHPSQQRHEKTVERITAVVAMLKGEGAFPETAYQRTQAIIAKSKEAFGVGGSQSTLHKPEYLPLWHPAHENTQTEERVNADSTVEKYPILPDPWDEAESDPKPFVVEAFSDLHVLPYYEGLCLPPASSGGEFEIEKQAANTGDQPQAGTTPSGEDSQNLAEERGLNFLTILFLTTASVSTIQTIPSDPTRVSTQLNQSEPTDKYYLYPPTPAAQPQKPEIDDKQPLSVPISAFWGVLVSFFCLNGYANAILRKRCASPIRGCPPSDAPSSTPVSLPSIVPPSAPCSIPPDDLLPDGGGTPHTGIYSNKASVVLFPSPPSAPSGEDVPIDSTHSPNGAFTPLQYREAIRFKLQASNQAKHLVRTFCLLEGIRLMPAQREDLEQLVKHHLMQRSPSPILHSEAAAWFAAHSDITAQINSLGVFWEYFQNLQ